MKRFRTVADLVEAIRLGKIPRDVISPGAAAAALGMTREGVHYLCKHDRLPAWQAERVVLIDASAVQAYRNKRLGIPAEQGDLYATE